MGDVQETSMVAESRALLSLAMPIMMGSMLSFLMILVDTAMVGRIGTEELAAAALGNTFYNTLQHPMVGCSLALDTLLSTSFGAGQLEAYGQWTRTGILVILALCLPFVLVLSQTEAILLVFGQDPILSARAGEFCTYLIPGVAPFFVFLCLTKHLQAQNILAPSVIIGLGANIFNGIANWVLIYGLGLGFKGAPIATSISRWAQCLMLIGYIFVTKRHHPTMPSCQIDAKRGVFRSQAAQFLRLGGPGALMLGLEAWSFELTTFLAAYLGTISLDAHVILLNIIGFTYMSLPFALGIAASIRVGHLLGAGEAKSAKMTSKAVGSLMIGFMVGLSLLKIALRDYLGLAFTDNEEVIRKVSGLVYIVALFQISDGVQAAVGGIMRGMGRQRAAAAMNFVGFWVIGVTVGAALTFGVGMGVAGLWWGLAAGLTCTAFIGMALLLRTDWDAEVDSARLRVGPETPATQEKAEPPAVVQAELPSLVTV